MLAVEALEAVAAATGAAPFDPLLARRTVVLRGRRFALDSGRGRCCSAAGGRPTRAPGWTS